MKIVQNDVRYKNMELWVSTVKLDIDHGYNGSHLWYETMIFGKDKEGNIDFMDKYCNRYATEEEAREGHNNVLKSLKNETIIYNNGYFELD